MSDYTTINENFSLTKHVSMMSLEYGVILNESLRKCLSLLEFFVKMSRHHNIIVSYAFRVIEIYN